jgi:starvation-inducible outer membrane lipoprotein
MGMRILLLTFLLAGCSSLPDEPKTIAAGAPGQVDYCVTVIGANFFCINAKRTMDSE